MFSRLRTTTDSIDINIDLMSALLTALHIIDTAKRGIVGFIHFTVDMAKIALTNYRAILDSDSVFEALSHFIWGTVGAINFALSISDFVAMGREAVRIILRKRAGKAVAAGAVSSLGIGAGIGVFFAMLIGLNYENDREQCEDTMMPVAEGTDDVIDAEEHDHDDNQTVEENEDDRSLDADTAVDINIDDAIPADD